MLIHLMALFIAMLTSVSIGLAQAEVTPAHAKRMAKGLAIFRDGVGQAMKQRCVKCHGGGKIRGELDITTRNLLLKGGSEGPAVVPGSAKASRLFRLISHVEKPHMPAKGEKLPAGLIAKFAEWIDMGAPYGEVLLDSKLAGGEMQITDSDREYWAFVPLKMTSVPKVKNSQWVSNEIDHFVLSKLEAAGLQPNNPAQHRALLRRLYFDIIGLPPAPEEVANFLAAADGNPRAALESVVDQLLNSPHYGERWGRHWLDLARYADSFGFEQDTDRNHAYHYRDFVIKALNNDMPYNQFVRWQIAGDEIAPENPLALMATGFLGAGVFPTQLTEKEFESARYDELDDMVGTMGTAMLGMTIGCARCHDHKFDPIPTRDYYRLITTFATTIRSEIDVDLNPEVTKADLAKWQVVHDKLAAGLARWEKESLRERLVAWVKNPPAESAGKFEWLVLDDLKIKSLNGAVFKRQGDGSFLLTGNNPKDDRWVITTELKSKALTGIRIEALAHESMKHNGPGRADNGNFALSDIRVFIESLDGGSKRVAVKLTNPQTTFEQNKEGLSVASSIDADKKKTGWAVDQGGIGKDQTAVFEFAEPVGFADGVKLTVELDFFTNTSHTIGRPRLAITRHPKPVPLKGSAQVASVTKLRAAFKDADNLDEFSEKDLQMLLRAYRTLDSEWLKRDAKLKAHLAAKPKPQTTKVQISSEGYKPMKHHADGRGFPHFYKHVHLLRRGDSRQKQEKMMQGFLRVLMRGAKDEEKWQQPKPNWARTSFRRKALANWLTDIDHGAGPLLARVIVNRLWKHHFGRGIVNTPNDFGLQGEVPTHPELLDFLAGKLINNGWRLKPLHKKIVMSYVYGQSADFSQDKSQVDAENRLYWRCTPRRLEAEPIRDSLLKVSGLLDTTMFGKGTLDPLMKRRSIYFQIKRSKLIPTMQLFDSPEPLVGQGARPSTIISPQALMFMNNAQIRAAAMSLAGKLETEVNSQAVMVGYQTVIGRAPSLREKQATLVFISKQEESYCEVGRNDARKLALADFAQVLFGLNEFVYVN
ncbi:PSD1 and planctomycete cytochrome C domain-containing protein [bacterium]|nr:PSD1 and planctomycete cytochrome C domain-containing protein [bacterium]